MEPISNQKAGVRQRLCAWQPLASARTALYFRFMAYASMLRDRAVIALAGTATRDFLQGLVTNDMDSCADGRAVYAALLTPQGKILFDFFLVPSGENTFLIDCAGNRAADLMKRLMLYRLRAKIDITARPDLAVAALWDAGPARDAHTDVTGFRDPRLSELGTRMIGSEQAVAAAARRCPTGDYHVHRIALGVPDSADLPPDSVFALDAGLEELNGVNFKKGCYVGQEVTSRMKHRATARRRFMIADFDGESPPSATPIVSEGRELGMLATGTEGHALALVRLDRFDEAQSKSAPISAGGKIIRLRKPGWLKL